MTKSRESLADKAYRTIEGLILSAELAPGTWIAESALAERVGLGRTPVREAIQRLSRHHLVEIATGRRLRITDVDVRDQLLIVELRRGIEPLLVQRAARYAGPGERAEMQALAAAAAAAGAARDTASFHRLDGEFRTLLLRAARHRFAAEAITPLWASSRRFAWIYRASEDVGAAAEMLGRLLRAVAAGDEAEATAATGARLDHLDRFARATLERRAEPSAA